MSKHTPGPWRAGFSPDHCERVGETILACVEHHAYDAIDVFAPPSRSLAEHEANARLIAAAPELLAALRRIVVNTGCSDGDCCPAAMAQTKAYKHASELIARLDAVDGGHVESPAK